MGERAQAVRVGRVVAVAHADGDSVISMVNRLASRGYHTRETPHFVLCQKRADGQIILMHTFNEATIDEDVSPMVGNELGAMGVITSPKEYGDTLFAVVASTCPSSLNCPDCGRLHLDQAAIWRHFSLNTLGRLRTLLSAPPSTTCEYTSHIALFGAIYRSIFECYVGVSLLDVGSNMGLLPVLLLERDRDVTVVGCDNRLDAVSCATELAATTGSSGVTFQVRDVLAPDFSDIGCFDTVTAVHLLEHLTEDELPVAFSHLLRVSARRLIVSVPYEKTIQPLYGHQQAFTLAKLNSWGAWCVETMAGGRYRCEDVGGGFLIVDR